MKIQSLREKPETKFQKLNKMLKENFGVTIKSQTNVKELVNMKKRLTERNNMLRHEKKAHMKNKEFSRNMLMLDAVNSALLVARRKHAARKALTEESNVEQAEVVIAANSFLDDLQDSLEKVGRLQNETLGPITDRMRDYYGSDVANSFFENVNDEFDTVMDALRDAKKNIGTAITAVSKGKKVEKRKDIDDFEDDEVEDKASDESMDDDVSDIDIDLDDIDDELEMGKKEAGRERKVEESRRPRRRKTTKRK